MPGAQRRSAPEPLSAAQTMTSTVTPAVSGATPAGVPSGTSSSIPKKTGMTVTGRSMTSVAETLPLRIRRKSAIRAERTNWKTADTTTRVASSAGPPFWIASTQSQMKAAELPITSVWPAPIRP